MASVDNVQVLQQRLEFEQKLVALVDRIHGAKSLDAIFIECRDEMLALFDAERLTLYGVDADKKEIFSKFLDLDTVREIRVPISESSLSGFAVANRQVVNISDAYDAAELARISTKLHFDNSFDKKTGFRTTQVLVVPIVHDNRAVVGALQLLNKKHGPRFTKEDEANLARIAKTLGIAFHNQTQLTQRRPTKFGYLLDHNRITQEDINAAQAAARANGVDVETVLVEQYKVPKAEMGMSLSLFYRVPYQDFDERIVPPPDLMKDLKLEFLKRNYWLPLRREEDGSILVLIDNPQDLGKVDSITQLLPRQKIRFAVGLRKEIATFLATAAGEGGPQGSISELIGELRTEEAPEKLEEMLGGEVDENDSTVVRLANQVIVDAYKARASDIHIEPYGAAKDTMIRYRVDGQCMEYQRIPGAYRRAIVARLKIMSMLDIAERRKPQDGKIKFRLPDSRDIELRVATIPTSGGNEDVVMRILAASEPIPIEKLGMTDRNLREMQAAAEKPYGLILVVGPTGSGKTTSLHSVLGYTNKPDRKIWTAEDPVEITQYGLRQVQVQPKIGFTFAAAMRAFLRADPDVIMVGEMRDKETAETGIEASLTGHLVFSTLHTNSSVETVIRLLDMGLDPFNFADALLGIMAQRLIRTLCPKCKDGYNPTPEEFEEIIEAYGYDYWPGTGITYSPELTLYRPKGCPTCNNTGYKGRMGVHELLVGTDELKKAVQARSPIDELRRLAMQQGMRTLMQDAVEKAFKGFTDIKQARAIAVK
ncbi:MAG TPA: GspE/PulE family protein [Terriglobales bacterium]|nr:GspE/PulE family protein [Terriglobales bacterium]